ncbi:Uncharacterised protein [Candidatus Bilamarchaeum dharawalense]|uniref:Uncharacterized protein n=1 Tax=Candidatus Bilamarchaeum dharawalense TaxID=2885759 RepID=A0A5E4LPA7_9ARCH|nr:Uncharacterised protein [Candidatus Bilamarchaeum dharawalense]
MNNNRKCLRGQIWTVDFITGLVALSFILMLYLIMWNTIAIRWGWAGKQTSMEASAYFASESLLATSGEPESWEMLPHIDENVSAIGLVNGRNELNKMKLEKFVAENATAYSTIKARLGMQRYEFGMRITDIGDNTVYYEFGKFSALNNSLNFDRLAILDGEPVIVHMEVWGG